MDDIFSDPKDDAEKEGDSNIEWKKSGIDKHERLTLKINVREANLYQAGKKNDLKGKKGLQAVKETPKGFKKVRRKIRDSMDEDEEDDDYILVPVFEDMRESSLMRALSEEEKKILQQNENINAVRMQENAGKEAAIARAEKVIMQAGLGRADAKLLNEERLKAGRVSVDEVVTDAVKQKAVGKQAKPSGLRREDGKARAAAREIARSRDEETKKAARKLNEVEQKAEEKARADKERTMPKDKEDINAAPQNVREEEIVKEELSSVKADEKAAVERRETEVSSVREEKPAMPEKNADEVNRDKINQASAPTEEKNIESAEKTEQQATVVKERQQAAEEAEKTAAVQEEAKEDAKEIVKEKNKEQPAEKREAEAKDSSAKEIIMEKSGRSRNNRQPQKKTNRNQLTEKEYQQALEAQIKHYQDREY